MEQKKNTKKVPFLVPMMPCLQAHYFFGQRRQPTTHNIQLHPPNIPLLLNSTH